MCERCHRSETMWVSGFKPEWQTGPPRIQLERPTVLMRLWAAVLALGALVAAGAVWVAGIAATALRWAQGACKRLGAWFVRLGRAVSAAARTFRDGMSRDRGEP